MVGSLFLGVLVVATLGALAAWGMWARRRGDPQGRLGEEPADRRAAGALPAPRPAAPASLTADLSRWVAAGLISAEQAEAIASHEGAALAAAPRRGRRVSLLAEALGYVGTALALAGAAVGLGQSWEDIPTWGRLAIAAGSTLLLLVGGAALFRQAEPAFRRLQSVLWALAVGAAAWTLAVLGIEVLDLEGAEPNVLLVGSGTAALAALLWALRQGALQQLVLFGAAHVALVGGLLCLPGEAPLWAFALPVWAFGVGWGVLGWREKLPPGWLAVALGSVGATVGPAVGIDAYPWLLAVALVTSLGLLAASLPTGQVPLLAVGPLGTFGYLIWAVGHYFEDSGWLPVAMVVLGAIFLALAVVAGRFTQVIRSRRSRARATQSAR